MNTLGYVSPRSSSLRGFINEMKENATFDSAEA